MTRSNGTAFDRLNGLLEERSARICIIGLGYVGLPTAVAFAQAGFAVVGVDSNPDRCSAVNTGHSHVPGVDDEVLGRLRSAGSFYATPNMSDASDCDVFDICVPTPLDKGRDPDLSAIVAALDGVRSILRPGQLILLTSTTYPGTTTELVRPVLEETGLVVGETIFLAFVPERIDPGNQRYGIRNTPKIVGGITTRCTELAEKVFGAIVDTIVPVSSPSAAEMSKLLENTFRSVNIALANEVALMCRRLELNVWEVIDAAATKPYGFMPFFPGPGLGGHCIPVDPGYLSWKLRRLNYVARFIELAENINGHMPEYVVDRGAEILNRQSKSINGARVLVLGVAYKRDIGDLRESPALDVISLLLRRGASVDYSDPFVPGPIYVDGMAMSSQVITPRLLKRTDLTVVATDHAAFDWALIHLHAAVVLDSRGLARRHGFADWETL